MVETKDNKETNKINDDAFSFENVSFELNTLEPIYYSEYFGGVTDFNLSIDDIRYLYTSKESKNKQKEQLNYLVLPEINFYIDDLGEVIDIEPIKNEIGVSNTPTQSMYAPMEMITENAYNIYQIIPDKDHIIYVAGNKEYVVKNSINYIYELIINNEKYYFDGYQYGFKYLKQYIALNGERI